jgi:hypothetical protein
LLKLPACLLDPCPLIVFSLMCLRLPLVPFGVVTVPIVGVVDVSIEVVCPVCGIVVVESTIPFFGMRVIGSVVLNLNGVVPQRGWQALIAFRLKIAPPRHRRFLPA